MKDKKLISTFKKIKIISSTNGGKLVKRLMIFDYQLVDRNDKTEADTNPGITEVSFKMNKIFEY